MSPPLEWDLGTRLGPHIAQGIRRGMQELMMALHYELRQ